MKGSIIIDTPQGAAARLNGEAMPQIVKEFSDAVVGKRIVKAGYVIEHGEAWPVLQLDNDEWIYAMDSDEGNGPGSISVSADNMLCQTSPK